MALSLVFSLGFAVSCSSCLANFHGIELDLGYALSRLTFLNVYSMGMGLASAIRPSRPI